ncbi:MAG: type II toxin-antitoxin system MqsA family antitoxin [Caldilineaceae bacterium]|nr:type II toxin-antitoxin system MqsA family antitoxin [Caldilineaceae bacterium]
MTDTPTAKACPFCGQTHFEEERTDYLYSHADSYLLVPNTPVLVCANCGMTFYDGAVLEEIERRFFAIQSHTETPDRIIQLPSMAFA